MKQAQKEAKVAQINELLNELNSSVTEDNQVKTEIKRPIIPSISLKRLVNNTINYIRQSAI